MLIPLVTKYTDENNYYLLTMTSATARHLNFAQRHFEIVLHP